MRCASAVLLLLCTSSLCSQQRVLHFTRTSGFDHGTRVVSNALFQSIGGELGVLVDDDATGDPFSEPDSLANYAVIVFSNTSGNAILNAQQRSNFEQWVTNGGRLMGIHAASDTYRHSTANGSNTGTWDFYAELIGASVQENPNHVAGTPLYSMQHIGSHASVANLPDPWVKNEEYYYWEGGYYGPDNTEVLRVEETIGPNGLVNSYDAPRPMSWYRQLTNGSRVFYTALGHSPDNYTSDMLFRAHIKDALVWLLEGATSVSTVCGEMVLDVFPNPTSDVMTIVSDASRTGMSLRMLDATGRIVLNTTITSERTALPVHQLAAGNYVVLVEGTARSVQIMR